MDAADHLVSGQAVTPRETPLQEQPGRLSFCSAWTDEFLGVTSTAVFVVDRRDRIIYLNRSAGVLSGWELERALDAPLDQVVRLAGDQKNLLDSLPPVSGAVTLLVLNKEAEPVSVVATVHALGESQDRLVMLQEDGEQEAAQKLRSYFLANITHEFRTPLSSLSASVEFLLEEMGRLSKTEIEELLRSVHLSVTGLQTLIDNLLESMSIEAGRFTIRCRAVELDSVVEEALQVMNPLLVRRGQRVRVDLQPQLPLVHGDETRLKQVLVNLLSNASKYGPIGQTIEVCAARQKNVVRVEVLDQGPGIPETERERLFHRYIRPHGKNGPQYGVGLGLSVVKAIVEEHGGKVSVEERPQGGSIFWFTVPVIGVRYESSDR